MDCNRQCISLKAAVALWHHCSLFSFTFSMSLHATQRKGEVAMVKLVAGLTSSFLSVVIGRLINALVNFIVHCILTLYSTTSLVCLFGHLPSFCINSFEVSTWPHNLSHFMRSLLGPEGVVRTLPKLLDLCRGSILLLLRLLTLSSDWDCSKKEWF